MHRQRDLFLSTFRRATDAHAASCGAVLHRRGDGAEIRVVERDVALIMNKRINPFLVAFALVLALLCFGAATATKYTGKFVGDGSGLTNLTAASAFPYVPQPASANLTNWSALAVTTRQPASANLTNWSAFAPTTTSASLSTNNATSLTNFNHVPVVIGGAGITVVTNTIAGTGEKTYTLTVP